MQKATNSLRRILRTKGAAEYLGLSESTLEKMRFERRGPRYVRLGGRAIGYLVPDLDDFIEAGRQKPVPPESRTKFCHHC